MWQRCGNQQGDRFSPYWNEVGVRMSQPFAGKTVHTVCPSEGRAGQTAARNVTNLAFQCFRHKYVYMPLSCFVFCPSHPLFYGPHNIRWGKRWRSWLRHCATSRKVAGSIPDGVVGILH